MSALGLIVPSSIIIALLLDESPGEPNSPPKSFTPSVYRYNLPLIAAAYTPFNENLLLISVTKSDKESPAWTSILTPLMKKSPAENDSSALPPTIAGWLAVHSLLPNNTHCPGATPAARLPLDL